MNEIKTPELNERWGMQVSLAGEVHINLKQMCITGSYSYYSCSPNISSPKLRSPWDDKVELVYITLSQQYLEQISSESETNTIESWFDLLGRNKSISGKAAHMWLFTWTYISLALAAVCFIIFSFYLWKWRQSFANTNPWQKDDHIMYLKGAKVRFESQNYCIYPLVVERQLNIAFWWLWEDCHSPDAFTK